MDTQTWLGSEYKPARAANSLWWSNYESYEAERGYSEYSQCYWCRVLLAGNTRALVPALSLSLPFSVSVSLFVSLRLCLSLSLCLSVSLSRSVSLRLSVSLSRCLAVSLPLPPPASLSVSLPLPLSRFRRHAHAPPRALACVQAEVAVELAHLARLFRLRVLRVFLHTLAWETVGAARHAQYVARFVALAARHGMRVGALGCTQ